MTDGPQLCGHCDAIEDPADGTVLHRVTCPEVTNLYPITPELGGMICPACGSNFTDEEYYTTVVMGVEHPIAREVIECAREQGDDVEGAKVIVAVCIGCAATRREIPDD